MASMQRRVVTNAVGPLKAFADSLKLLLKQCGFSTHIPSPHKFNSVCLQSGFGSN